MAGSESPNILRYGVDGERDFDFWRTAKRSMKGAFALLGLAVIVTAVVAYFYERVPADADSIVNATFGLDRFRGTGDEKLIEAIRRFGDVNGWSPRHRCSFLYAAVSSDHDRLASWLLENGADPNAKGDPPLLSCIRSRDGRMAKQLLRSGARWDVKLESGEVLEEAARRIDAGLVERLKRWEREQLTTDRTGG